jgi:hypothetical protein
MHIGGMSTSKSNNTMNDTQNKPSPQAQLLATLQNKIKTSFSSTETSRSYNSIHNERSVVTVVSNNLL